MKALGRHILSEFYDCDKKVLDNHELIQESMVKAAKDAKATVVETAFHKFNPYGVSGMVVIAESHLAIHTWPEYGYAAVDVFTCGDEIDPWLIHQSLVDAFSSKRHEANEIPRGVLGGKNLTHKLVLAGV
ncbi:MAG: adenosylmethionine decarboxylase [candidate division FCPU426 bacterium]